MRGQRFSNSDGSSTDPRYTRAGVVVGNTMYEYGSDGAFTGARAFVGASIWQTPGGVQSELDAINADVLAFSAEISGYVGAKADPAIVGGWWEDFKDGVTGFGPGRAALNEALAIGDAHRVEAITKSTLPATPTDPKHMNLAAFYTTVWIPFVTNWRKFYDENKSWGANLWWNHAPEAEQYLDQLNEIRAKARKMGLAVNSPEPHKFGKSKLFDPGHNVTDDVADAPGKILGDTELLLKIAVIGGVGILGAVAFGSLFSNLRSGKDPADNYMRFARIPRARKR